MISEKVELLGKGTYDGIPDELTLLTMSTSSEMDYVSGEDFDETMLDVILPKCVKEDIDFRKLLEIDYYWVCRALRILNYGPYFTTNSIYCKQCGEASRGEYRVDLRTIGCKMLPDKFVNDITISADKFLDFKKDIHLHMFTIQDKINAYKDKMFTRSNGAVARELSRICYMVTYIGNENMTPVQSKLIIEEEMSPADYVILKEEVRNLTDYGLRVGGSCQCPKCKSNEGAFIALMDDKFFRPTVGDLREWANSRGSRGSDRNK